MNFLGHAYIARNNPELIAGNFAGDSYKGYLDKYDDISEDILKGVKLHRFIDDFTDQNENIKNVAEIFKNEGINKISFIACDIILDHHISSKWEDYSKFRYKEFVDFIYSNTDHKLNELPQEFNRLYSMLKQYGWLFDYPSVEGISKILHQFSSRIGFDNELHKSIHVYVNFQKEIDESFKTFMNEINDSSQKFILENLS